MEFLDNILDKVANLPGKPFSADRPDGFFSDPESHEYHMSMIWDHAAHNEVHLPIVMKEAKGAYMWDVKGNKYIDFMACHSAVNQGHCHPKILEAINEQAKLLTLTSSICNHNVLGPVAKKITERFGYDKILFRNSGSEAVETCVLTARKWGYKKKKIPYGKATVLFAENCYWGMILSARSGSTDKDRRELCEPLATEALHFEFVGFDNTDILEAKLKSNPNICAYIFEPIQGHAGNIYPSPGYYTKVRELCTKYNVLMITDECQTGLGRVGRLLGCDWEGVRPDMIALGKSLGAGYMPVSAVLGNNDVMDVWPPPTSHLSTYASNPLACVVAAAAVDIVFEENLIENSATLGKIVAEEFETYDYPFIVKKNYGKGLFASLEFKDLKGCWAVCINMMKKGILTKPEAGAHLKVNPPLCISEEDLRYGLKVLKESLDDYNKKGVLGIVI